MSIAQTNKSQPGGGPRAQGVALPSGEELARRMRDEVSQLVEARNPGLQATLDALWSLAGGGSVHARAGIPGEKIRSAAMNGLKLEDLATEVTITATSAQAVAVLHKVIALGVDAYLGDPDAVCKWCGEPVQSRSTGDGADVVWFHRSTAKIMCEDGAHVAVKRTNRRRS